MSTKIPYAWRCRVGRLTTDLLPLFRDTCFDSAAAMIRGRTGPRPDHKDLIRELAYARELSKTEERLDPARDIACKLNVWLCGRWAYGVPVGEGWLWETLKPTAHVHDYCYWNHTDPPADVSHAAWRGRRAVWDTVLEDFDAARLCHTVIDPARKVGGDELARRVLRAPKASGYYYWGK